jgi:hypothetical protein
MGSTRVKKKKTTHHPRLRFLLRCHSRSLLLPPRWVPRSSEPLSKSVLEGGASKKCSRSKARWPWAKGEKIIRRNLKKLVTKRRKIKKNQMSEEFERRIENSKIEKVKRAPSHVTKNSNAPKKKISVPNKLISLRETPSKIKKSTRTKY